MKHNAQQSNLCLCLYLYLYLYWNTSTSTDIYKKSINFRHHGYSSIPFLYSPLLYSAACRAVSLCVRQSERAVQESR
jgi:hypothetical protein